MNSNRSIGLLIAAAATIAAGAGAHAAVTAAETNASSSATATTTPTARQWHHRHRSLLVGTTLRAARQLGLSSDQQQQIKEILSLARTQHQQPTPPDMAALGNPADPNYAAALQSAKTLATARLQRESELQSQIYGVLTADQKAKLPQVLADMKAKAQQRRAAWQQRAGSSGDPAGAAAGSN